MTLKYEFDNIEEYREARRNLSKYHDCDKCRGKIVLITMDNLGNTCCGYCNKIVRYPTLTREAMDKHMSEELK